MSKVVSAMSLSRLAATRSQIEAPLSFNVATTDPCTSGAYRLSFAEGFDEILGGALYEALMEVLLQHGHELVGLKGTLALEIPLENGRSSMVFVENVKSLSKLNVKFSLPTHKCTTHVLRDAADHFVSFEDGEVTAFAMAGVA